MRTCPHCQWTWLPRVAAPKRCPGPLCGRFLPPWDKPRKEE